VPAPEASRTDDDAPRTPSSRKGGAPSGPKGTASPTRRAALIATALTLPVVVLLAFAFAGGLGDDGPGDVEVSAPPRVEACDALMDALPEDFQQLEAREVDSDSTQVRAWGDPATVLRCGVGRPAELAPGSAAQLFYINDVLWMPEPNTSGEIDASKPLVMTVVDRDVYIEVTSPSGTRLDATPLISEVIAEVFRPVCKGQASLTEPPVPDAELCTHRP
jgi:hypothetical protein